MHTGFWGGKSEGKRPIERPRHRWEDNIVTSMSLIRGVIVRMIGFISNWVTQSLVITLTHRRYSTIFVLQQLQFTVAHALGFSVSTSRFPATDLDT
jgi:hypothetical protein